MTRDWLILADDLTGAADCAIAFGRRGRTAAVTWGEVADASDHQLPVLAYDAASRGLSAAAAAACHAYLLARLSGERILFKKIDSTLRGQPAAETTAALAHLKSRFGAAFGVFAPAFPATGRTTIDGRIFVNGRPLEEAEVWRRDHTYPSADLVDVLATAGVRGEKIALATVRGGDLKAIFARLASEGDVVAACDAETDHDLHLIAEASLPASPATFFIGSAGFAHALAGLDAGDAAEPLRIPARTSGTLIVVGSLAGASRAAARKLQETGTVMHFPVDPELLLNNNDAGRAALAADVMKRIANGGDALVEIMMDDHPDLSLGPKLAQGLAETLATVAPAIGAFAATGGETAAALLSRFGVNGIRLADEIEPGVSLGLTLGQLSIPIATKAGAFGDEHSLIRISERLRAVRTKGSFA
ncbi:four-carbon acid sugar kinase family protein [Bradyrhizobium sp. SYSU BS000235]|uniref:four-carbon acid sugar kinase family protein n=1 Tax=Bradyrhizobium sp. SYSU BS000235 TaxID=3411332 RepID=UPI003C73B1A0